MLPTFSASRIVLAPGDVRYNPCNDLIFPTVLRAADCLAQPLANYYLYYAPHDAPGGLCLATANTPDGPWTEYPGNPIVTRDWPPHYSVSHVSSPHVMWMPHESKLFCYFHGENDTTRLATSADGIHFDYVDEVATTKMFDEITESSYARVFPTTARAGMNYVMLFMGNNQGTRRIYAAWSADGRTFTAQKRPLINPPPGTGVTQCGGPFLWRIGGRNIVLFHGDQMSEQWNDLYSNVFAVDVGEAFDQESHLGVFYQHTSAGGVNHRVSDAFIYEEAGQRWMFTAVGKRLAQSIAVARGI